MFVSPRKDAEYYKQLEDAGFRLDFGPLVKRVVQEDGPASPVLGPRRRRERQHHDVPPAWLWVPCWIQKGPVASGLILWHHMAIQEDAMAYGPYGWLMVDELMVESIPKMSGRCSSDD